MKKDYFQPQVSVEEFNIQEVILGSGMADDDFGDGYNVIG